MPFGWKLGSIGVMLKTSTSCPFYPDYRQGNILEQSLPIYDALRKHLHEKSGWTYEHTTHLGFHRQGSGFRSICYRTYPRGQSPLGLCATIIHTGRFRRG